MSSSTPEIARIQFRNGLAADWTAANPVLEEGEPGYERDTDLFKIGDGSSSWTQLPYAGQGVGPATSLALGSIQLTADLGGSATAPQVPGLDQKANTAAVALKRDRIREKRTITGNYTLTTDDAEDVILHSIANTPVTITVPTDANAALAEEDEKEWRQWGNGQITFAAQAGATVFNLLGNLKTTGRGASGRLVKVAPNSWMVTGDLGTTGTPPPASGFSVVDSYVSPGSVSGATLNVTPTTGEHTLLFVTAVATNAVISTPTGWSVLVPSTQGSSTTNHAFAVFYRQKQSGDAATVTFATNATGRVVAATVRVPGADTTTPFTAPAPAVYGAVAAGATPTLSGVTGRTLINAYSARNPNTAATAATTWTPPGTVSEVLDIATFQSATTNATMELTTEQLASTATTTARTSTASETMGGLVTAAIMVNPAGSVVDTPAPTPNPPGAVASFTLTAQNAAIAFAWTAPTSNGGAAIDKYRLSIPSIAYSVEFPATQLSQTVTGLTNGQAYSGTIEAHNSAGYGPGTTKSATPTAGGTTPTPGTGFASKVLADTKVRRYFPMNSNYQLLDLKGGAPLSNTGGGVTFGNLGALFEGLASDYLTAPSSTDFSVRNSTNVLSIFFAITFPTYAQPDQFHFMGKGGDQSDNYEWAMRLYGDTNAARKRNVSNYYWNPNPSVDINGNSVPSRRGSGAYLAPPTAAPDFGGSERQNGPVHSGEIGVEHWFGLEFVYAANYAGSCKLWYGDIYNQMTKLSDRAMDADALVTPQYTNGRLFVGKRGDSDGMVKATIRRLIFSNALRTQTEWRALVNNTNMALAEG